MSRNHFLNRKSGDDWMFYLLFFMPLLGFNILAYAFILLYFLYYGILNHKNISNRGLFVFLMVALFCVVKYLQMEAFVDFTVILRYYFGVAFMIYYLSTSKFFLKDIDKLILIFCSEILIEAILINTFVSPSFLPNYPHHEYAINFDEVISSVGFQRPYSIGNNATVTSTILCMLLALRESIHKLGVLRNNKRLELISAFAILITASGTGLFLYMIVLFYKYKDKINITTIVGLIFAFFIFSFILKNTAVGQIILFRFGFNELTEMYDFKIEQLDAYLYTVRDNTPWLGSSFKTTPLLTQGDSAWVETYLSIGILGLSILGSIFLFFLNKFNRVPLMIGLIGAFHYGGIFSEPGQLLLAYILLSNKNLYKNKNYQIGLI